MSGRRLSTKPADRGEEGYILIAALTLITVISLLVAAVAQDAVSAMALSRRTEDRNSALAAAQAGASDLSYRLNAQEAYSYCIALAVQNVAKASTGYCSATSAPGVPPASVPDASGRATGTSWVAEPSDGTNLISCFQYGIPAGTGVQGTVTASGAAATAVLLDVTGKVTRGSCSATALAQRSIRVTLERDTYLNYAYFTDLETNDPAQYALNLSSQNAAIQAPGQPTGTYLTNAQVKAYADTYCSNYYYALSASNAALLGQANSDGVTVQSTDIRANHSTPLSGPTANTICGYSRWGTGDTFNGPVHTNDTFFYNGATTYSGNVEVGHDSSGSCTPGYTASAANNYGQGVLWVDWNQVTGGTPLSYANGTAPVFGGTILCRTAIPLPSQNSSLLSQAQAGGCVYKGLTYFYFEKSGAIDVYSPGTAVGTAGLSGGCPVNGSFTPASYGSSFNGVLYVQNTASACTLTTAANGPLIPGLFGNSLGRIIQDNDLNQLENEDLGATQPWGAKGVNQQAYDCHNGDAFVGGYPKGQLTVGSDNNVVVYQNLIYADSPTATTIQAGSTNVLGLEPGHSVQLYNPVSCHLWDTTQVAAGTEPAYSTCANGGSNLLPSSSSCPVDTACITTSLQGAVLCLNGELTLENWTYGTWLGTLTILGSLTQHYRGGLAGTYGGYVKSYNYDSRLADITPPAFLPPSIFSWTTASFAETTADSSH